MANLAQSEHRPARGRVPIHMSCTNRGSMDECRQQLAQTNEVGMGAGESRHIQMGTNECKQRCVWTSTYTGTYMSVNTDEWVQTQVHTVQMSEGEGRHEWMRWSMGAVASECNSTPYQTLSTRGVFLHSFILLSFPIFFLIFWNVPCTVYNIELLIHVLNETTMGKRYSMEIMGWYVPVPTTGRVSAGTGRVGENHTLHIAVESFNSNRRGLVVRWHVGLYLCVAHLNKEVVWVNILQPLACC